MREDCLSSWSLLMVWKALALTECKYGELMTFWTEANGKIHQFRHGRLLENSKISINHGKVLLLGVLSLFIVACIGVFSRLGLILKG